MGFKYGSKLFYSIKDVSFPDLATIIRNRCSERVADDETICTPTVYFDVSWLARELSTKTSLCPVDDIISLASQFAKENISVVLTNDNSTYRHHSKKATICRDQKAEQARIDTTFLKKKMVSMVDDSRSPNTTQEELTIINKEINDLVKVINRKENIIRNRLTYINLFDILHEKLDIFILDHDHLKISIIEAVTQADHVICYQAVHGDCDAAIADDGDFIMMAGKKMLMVKDFNFSHRGNTKGTASGFCLVSSHLKTLEDPWCNILKKEKNSIITPGSGFNILETDDIHLRAGIALGTGCDILPDRIKGIGVSTIKKFFDSNEPDVNKLLEMYSAKDGTNLNVLKAYLSALVYETGDIVGDATTNSTTSHRHYIHSIPDCLPTYCEEFRSRDTKIDNTLKILKCVGHIKQPHIFMEYEGVNNCADCNTTMCSLCVANTKEKVMAHSTHNNLCLPCYDKRLNGTIDESLTTMIDMKRILLFDHNIIDVNDLSYSEITELYDLLTNSKNNMHDRDLVTKFPKYASDKKYEEQEFSIPFNMKEGAHFLRHEEFNDDQLIQMVSLLSKFIKYSKRKDTKVDICERAVPDIVRDICKESRIDGGHRLMKRANRHANDPRTPSMIKAAGFIKIIDGNCCIEITTDVQASMKDDIYSNTACFSKDGLNYCECDCKAGSCGKERAVCVHTPSLGVMMSHIILDGLSESILVECSSAWGNKQHKIENDKLAMKEFRDDLLRLISVVDYNQYNDAKEKEKISDILAAMTVGTEKAKVTPLPPPMGFKFSTLRNLNRKYEPMREMKLVSPAQQVLTKLSNILDVKSVANANENEICNNGITEDIPLRPNYVTTYLTIKTLQAINTKDSTLVTRCMDSSQKINNYVGHKVLQLRYLDAVRNEIFNEDIIKFEMNEKWIKALGEKSTTRRWKQQIVNTTKSKKRQMKGEPIGKRVGKRHKKKNTTSSSHFWRFRKSGTRYCVVPGCETHNNTFKAKLKQIPKIPSYPKTEHYDPVLNYYRKYLERRSLLKACAIPLDCDDEYLYVCNLHTKEERIFTIKNVQYKTLKGKKKSIDSMKIKVPCIKPDGIKDLFRNPDYGESRGTALQRRKLIEIETALKNENEDRVEVMRVIECYEDEINKSNINDKNNDQKKDSNVTHVQEDIDKILLDKTSLSTHIHTMVPKYTDDMKGNKKIDSTTVDKIVDTPLQPILSPTSLSPREVKTRTGFQDACHLISFVAIVCNGDIDLITERNSWLTWYEEWFLYFEFLYGRTVVHFRGTAVTYKTNKNTVARIVKKKIKMIKKMRDLWPKYLSYKEDDFLRDTKWEHRYIGKRIVFHDNTGLDIVKPSDSLSQRVTYSSYYGGNVAKGGVFVQLCGWIGTYELYPGAVSDSDYMNLCGIFENQKRFQESDGGDPFLNVLDRGYRVTKIAWKNGRQFVLQPIFAKSDRKFNTIETLKSSSIAADRSGNERSVRLCKLCNVFKNYSTCGQTSEDIERICDFWLTQSFQVNFMYKNVM